ncbi:hypothetical protein [Actinacidiphila bryophytorum]|uniref:hypothetical protein n=1 Tax=Actinacidiphila bryophytorum TaxID=1436133 RepID=UPI002AFF49A4|nr:hypothetical protein [Actinacidiphila bryophytorum]
MSTRAASAGAPGLGRGGGLRRRLGGVLGRGWAGGCVGGCAGGATSGRVTGGGGVCGAAAAAGAGVPAGEPGAACRAGISAASAPGSHCSGLRSSVCCDAAWHSRTTSASEGRSPGSLARHRLTSGPSSAGRVARSGSSWTMR